MCVYCRQRQKTRDKKREPEQDINLCKRHLRKGGVAAAPGLGIEAIAVQTQWGGESLPEAMIRVVFRDCSNSGPPAPSLQRSLRRALHDGSRKTDLWGHGELRLGFQAAFKVCVCVWFGIVWNQNKRKFKPPQELTGLLVFVVLRPVLQIME